MNQKIKDCIVMIEEITADMDIDLRNQIIDFYPTFVNGLIKSSVCFPELKQGKIDMPFIETRIFGTTLPPLSSGQLANHVRPQDGTELTFMCPHCCEKLC